MHTDRGRGQGWNRDLVRPLWVVTERIGRQARCPARIGCEGFGHEMDVKLFGSNKRNDTDIACAAENILQWTTYLPKDSVKIMVEVAMSL